MKIRYATKRDRSGNRYYLIVDDRERTFSFQPTHWYSREDFIEISKTDYRRLRDNLREHETMYNDYREIEHDY